MSEVQNETVREGMAGIRDALYALMEAMKEQTRVLDLIAHKLDTIADEVSHND